MQMVWDGVLVPISTLYLEKRASLVAQTVKNLPAMQETWVRSLGPEGPLEEGMAPHSSILENPMDRGAWRATLPLSHYIYNR